MSVVLSNNVDFFLYLATYSCLIEYYDTSGPAIAHAIYRVTGKWFRKLPKQKMHRSRSLIGAGLCYEVFGTIPDF